VIGWLFNKWANNRQIKEAKDFLDRVKSMNSDELSIPLLVVLETANMAFEEKGIDVFDPFPAMAKDPSVALYFSKMVIELQKIGRQPLAPGPMVWTHTMRATYNHNVRNLVRDIWTELHRGEPFVEDARDELFSVYDMWPSLDRLGETPIGLESEKSGRGDK